MMLDLFVLFAAFVGSYGQTCPGNTNSVLTAATRGAILQVHNNMRESIAKGTLSTLSNTAGPATNMRKLSWSCALEQQAQAWANRCMFSHSNGQNYGENLYMFWSTSTLDANQQAINASNSWASEFQKYGWPSPLFPADYSEFNIGDATQMAWANTNEVGCGSSMCSFFSFNQVMVVCQYIPQGNILGTYAYDLGPTCSNCGPGYTCEQSSGLCVSTASTGSA